MTKIEELKKLQYDMANNKYIVQRCLGKKFDKEENKYIVDSRNDKHDFKFSKNSHHSSKSIYLDAYYGYYGDGSVSMFNNEFYMECMIEAINNFLPEIREKTENIMQERVNKVLIQAKDEAEDIMKQIEELGLSDWNNDFLWK